MNNNIQTDSDDHLQLSEDALNLFSKATMLELTPTEKEEGYNTLKSFIQTQQISNNAGGDVKNGSQLLQKSILSPYAGKLSLYIPSFIKNKQLVYAIILGCFIFSFAAGCAQAAQSSLPGDLLYPIKTQINERVERVFAFGAEAKARVAVKQAVTRLEETQKLIATKKIDAVDSVSLDKDLANTSSYIAKNIAQLKAEGQADLAIQISSDFEDSMNTHEKGIADALKDAPENTQKAISTVRELVRSRIASSATVRTDLEGTLTPSNKIRKIKESAISELDYSQKKIEYAEKFVQTTGVAISPSEEEDENIQQNIEYIKKTVAKGKEKLNVGAYTDALILFKNAGKNAEHIDKQIRDLNKLKQSEKSIESDHVAGSNSTESAIILVVSTSTVVNASTSSTSSTSISGATNTSNLPSSMTGQTNQPSTDVVSIPPVVITPPALPAVSTGSLVPGL